MPVSDQATQGSGAGIGNVTITLDRLILAELREIARRNRRSLNQQVGLYVDQGVEQERLTQVEHDLSHRAADRGASA